MDGFPSKLMSCPGISQPPIITSQASSRYQVLNLELRCYLQKYHLPCLSEKKEIAKIDIFVNLITKPLTHAIPTITDLAKHLLRKGAKQNFLMTRGGGKCKRIFPKNLVSKQKKTLGKLPELVSIVWHNFLRPSLAPSSSSARTNMTSPSMWSLWLRS